MMKDRKKLERKANIEADAILRQNHYDEWYVIYQKILRRLNFANRSNKKIIESIYKKTGDKG